MTNKLTVFAVKAGSGEAKWVQAGTAWVNRDGSLNVYLDVLPLDGKLHLRNEAPNIEHVKAADKHAALEQAARALMLEHKLGREPLAADWKRLEEALGGM